jgi:hypothetical protein
VRNVGLSANPSAISVAGSQLEVPQQKTLSVMGGEVTIKNGMLAAPSGQINIASVASEGEVIIGKDNQNPNLNVESFSHLGNIILSDSTNLSTSGESGGTVVIRGGQLMVDNASIELDTHGTADGVPTGLDIQVSRDLVLTNGALVTSDVFGAGDAGDIQVRAKNLEVTEGATLRSRAFSSSSGATGTINVTAESVQIKGGGKIESTTDSVSTGQVGQIVIIAQTVNL